MKIFSNTSDVCALHGVGLSERKYHELVFVIIELSSNKWRRIFEFRVRRLRRRLRRRIVQRELLRRQIIQRYVWLKTRIERMREIEIRMERKLWILTHEGTLFKILKEMILIASISTYFHCIIFQPQVIILKECIGLNTIKRQSRQDFLI